MSLNAISTDLLGVAIFKLLLPLSGPLRMFLQGLS